MVWYPQGILALVPSWSSPSEGAQVGWHRSRGSLPGQGNVFTQKCPLRWKQDGFCGIWQLVVPTAANPVLICCVHLGEMPELTSPLTLWSTHPTAWPPNCYGATASSLQPQGLHTL